MLLKQRKLEPELMDDPLLGQREHDAALRGLRRINRISRSSHQLWKVLRRQAGDLGNQPLRVLDVASGGGDTVVALSKRAHLNGIRIELDGCDISSHATSHARKLADAKSPIKNEFFTRDVLTGGLPDGYHVIMCSLFLHHLTKEEAIDLMRSMAASCLSCLLIDDLRRTSLGYALAWSGCRLLSRSPVVHFDGPQSVKAAFEDAEVHQLAENAGLSGYRLRRHWPQRFLLSWNKS